MSVPYGDNNGYNGYVADPINRAPSPYHQQAPSPYQQPQASNSHNNGYNVYVADPINRASSPYGPVNRAPSPYQQPGAASSYYDSHSQQYDNAVPIGQASPYSESGPTPGSEGERGLLGALGGAAGGGYIGHKTCHAFLGTIGGAIVGSLTEDWAKKNKPLYGKPAPQNCAPVQRPGCSPPEPGYYPQPLVDTHTNVSTSTHVYSDTVQYPTQPPVYQAPHKPCGHQHHCGCQYFHRN